MGGSGRFLFSRVLLLFLGLNVYSIASFAGASAQLEGFCQRVSVAGGDKFKDLTSGVSSANNAVLVKIVNSLADDIFPRFGKGFGNESIQGGNFVLYPLGIAKAVAALGTASIGRTQQEIGSTLAVQPSLFNDEKWLGQLQNFEKRVRCPNTGENHLDLAQLFYLQKKFPVVTAFIRIQKQFFDSDVLELEAESKPFLSVALQRSVGAWLASRIDNQSTKNAIEFQESITGKAGENRPIRLGLASAQGFSLATKFPFAECSDCGKVFRNAGGKTKPTRFFVAHGKPGAFRHGEFSSFEIVEIPMTNPDQYLYLWVPFKPESMDDIVGKFSVSRFMEYIKKMRGTNIDVIMPSTSFNFGLEGKTMLSASGIKLAYDPPNAEFTAIDHGAGHLFLDDGSIHFFNHWDWTPKISKNDKSQVKTLRRSTGLLEPIQVIADRDFMFTVFDKKLGLVLALGLVKEPADQR